MVFFGDGQGQNERERESCSNPKYFPVEDLLMVSHPQFLLEKQTRKARQWNGGCVKVGEHKIIISCDRDEGAAFIGETCKSKTAKEVSWVLWIRHWR